jgi:hypothetical protein
MNEKVIVPISVKHIEAIQKIADQLGVKSYQLICYWLTEKIRDFEASNSKNNRR